MSDPAITCEGLRRAFPTGVALEHLDLEVPAGEVLALLGPNGAGKTTTVRILNGVLRADSGQARVLGYDPATQGDELRRNTGVLTENAGLDDRLTAFENVDYTARLRGMARREAETRTNALLEQFGLADRRDHPVQGMSTGQRKRVALARAMIHDPQLLFLDEPTSGLDPAATRAVLDLVQSLARERGRTVVLCTHFLGEAGQLADRMAILHKGRLRANGRPAELAAALQPGLAVELDLGQAADVGRLTALLGIRNVLSAEPNDRGALVRVGDRADVPGLVRHLVDAGWDVFGATPRPMTLEDVYFAIAAQADAANPDAPIVTTAGALAQLGAR